MASRLFPADPSSVLVIRDLTPNITTLSLPFSRGGVIKFGARATLARLTTTGSLAVFSPVALTPEVREKIAALASPDLAPDERVSHIVAPDIEHHIYLSDWKAAFPTAKIIGPEGLPEKRAAQGKHEEFAVVFPVGKGGASSSTPSTKDDNTSSRSSSTKDDIIPPKRSVTVDAAFDADFSYELVDAHVNRELVFFYKPDRVLIQADLLFNLPPVEQYSRAPEADRRSGFFDGLVSRLMTTGTRGEDLTWPRRVHWHLFSRANREGFDDSMRVIDGWDFETVVPCHGETMVGDGKERFRALFGWHLEAAEERARGGGMKQD